MVDVIDTDIIKTTQASLGKYVKRPPLTDKLLKKPPFRFLHDVITSVLKSTGFFNGLFEDVELISDNVKDRESKILFLTKVISVVGRTTGKPLSVKPSKIVAGQEPEKTNELLQCLAFALDKKLSSDDAVRLYKESGNSYVSNENKGKDISKTFTKSTDTKKVTLKTSEKLVKTDKNPSKAKLRENSTLKKDSPPKKVTQPTKTLSKKAPEKEKQEIKINKTSENKINYSNEKEESRQNSVEAESIITTSNLEIIDDSKNSAAFSSNVNDTKNITEGSLNLVEVDPHISEEKIINAPLDKNNEITTTEINVEKHDTNEHVSNEYENPSNVVNKNVLLESTTVNINENLPKQNISVTNHFQSEVNTTEIKISDNSYGKRPNSVRPSSSRPSAPRFRDKHELLLSAVDNLVVGKVNIIAENTTQEEEESSIVIVDNIETNLENEDIQLQTSSNRHGHLVQQILNSQKEFTEVAGKTNIEWKFEAQKAKDVVNQEIEQLRFNVHALSRVANPLGKLLDHIQEDVEVMRQELQQWTKSYEEASKQLLKQKAANEDSLFPLHSKVKQLEGEITDKSDKINDLKIIIHKNALRIEKLLASGNVQ